jgi:hypothetical protein
LKRSTPWFIIFLHHFLCLAIKRIAEFVFARIMTAIATAKLMCYLRQNSDRSTNAILFIPYNACTSWKVPKRSHLCLFFYYSWWCGSHETRGLFMRKFLSTIITPTAGNFKDIKGFSREFCVWICGEGKNFDYFTDFTFWL